MQKIVVADADILVALAFEGDNNHEKAKDITRGLRERLYDVYFPNTAILEAITALKRGLSQPSKAHLINRQYLTGAFDVIYVNEEIQQEASRLFEEKADSKKNTIFDAVVAVVARKLSADAVFSFDNWYTKLDFTTASDLVSPN